MRLVRANAAGHVATILTFLLLAAPVSYASRGDRDSLYINCVHKCYKSSCSSPDADAQLPFILQLTRWTCRENCQYECMHDVTTTYLASGHPVEQYYGKWPFIRFLGLQEPASVIFSILNGYMHWIGYRKLRRHIPRWYPLRRIYLLNALLGVNAWIWSTVFHARDFPLTEKLDYFSAIGSILFAACLAVIRVFQFQHRRNVESWMLTGFATLFYVAHVSYLSFWPFDYGYNMIAGVTVGVASNTVWIWWFLNNWRSRPYAWKVLLSVVLISAAMSLELLDFPPWKWAIDAHALWHAATIPLVYLFYSFLLDDVRWEIRAGKGKAPVH
ncbi:uncharacterized protein SPPG_06009 [Spizellomyces punctatus DAOM BR117]|uniref:Post-GPI attachment to proteins factor 3 n=1 Tax=Spizellomyces punctatus (strain DAOM BR117) TaxID=645134 RepID=A0A0L0HC02_SPIPD|nr:uncharacterized protein SPPG_06009 [Spizellomyces punctatus DAOM BR117]KNC99060.1 hypothetical protein SPPG_06009 [Spizellomyces punctatus DAOM BR117]|eukprot:XP_016607100.1 hypothetical protein SPPG_06009 [Spizellomyces punctatus DAOM BR117]